ncbi:PP2C family protein-serine/threonine phosphatase [Yoonia sp.]|uniref:PP2C family protein-serine/threonine phosphatase n=1 Tax=Yoonia sp. TaxID=2212373 RepID=UPI00391C111B
MNIKNTLAVLFSTFGLVLVALLAPQVQSSYQYYNDTSDQIVVDRARNDVFEAVLAIREGRSALALLGIQGQDSADLLGDLSAAVVFLTSAAETIAKSENDILRPLSAPLAQQAPKLSDIAEELSRAITTGVPGEIAATVQELEGAFADVQRETLLVREQILQEIGIPDATMGAVQVTRNYILSVSSMLNDDLVLAAPADDAMVSLSAWQIQRSVDRMIAINQFYADISSAYRNDTVLIASDLFDYIDAIYQPALENYAEAIAQDTNLQAARQDWAEALNDADALISQTTSRLFQTSQAHLISESAAARARLSNFLTWTAFAVVVFGLSIYLVAQHIVKPLLYVQRKINDIASGRLDPITKRRLLLRDLDSVIDSLRALRISARRRERLATERLALNEQIIQAHATLKSEVDAAAKVQLSLLPRPEDVGHMRFSTLFQPSHVVAGDTYDFIPLSDTRVGLFQIDVAGHGAAAGLVSMAAHISARRALRGVKSGIDLAASVQTLNTHWSPELTYFTALLVEFDSSTHVARLVQAGHPHPVLMRKDGSVSRLGNAGLPIGVIGDADYELIEFPFEHGDRLLVFSDGIYENFNSEGEIYSEERLIQLLRDNAACSTDVLVDIVKKSVVSWNESGIPSDDVSLVIAERV